MTFKTIAAECERLARQSCDPELVDHLMLCAEALGQGLCLSCRAKAREVQGVCRPCYVKISRAAGRMPGRIVESAAPTWHDDGVAPYASNGKPGES